MCARRKTAGSADAHHEPVVEGGKSRRARKRRALSAPLRRRRRPVIAAVHTAEGELPSARAVVDITTAARRQYIRPVTPAAHPGGGVLALLLGALLVVGGEHGF
jgi:hypothetical protein